jgi:hypothetical protein
MPDRFNDPGWRLIIACAAASLFCLVLMMLATTGPRWR